MVRQTLTTLDKLPGLIGSSPERVIALHTGGLPGFQEAFKYLTQPYISTGFDLSINQDQAEILSATGMDPTSDAWRRELFNFIRTNCIAFANTVCRQSDLRIYIHGFGLYGHENIEPLQVMVENNILNNIPNSVLMTTSRLYGFRQKPTSNPPGALITLVEPMIPGKISNEDPALYFSAGIPELYSALVHCVETDRNKLALMAMNIMMSESFMDTSGLERIPQNRRNEFLSRLFSLDTFHLPIIRNILEKMGIALDISDSIMLTRIIGDFLLHNGLAYNIQGRSPYIEVVPTAAAKAIWTNKYAKAVLSIKD